MSQHTFVERAREQMPGSPERAQHVLRSPAGREGSGCPPLAVPPEPLSLLSRELPRFASLPSLQQHPCPRPVLCDFTGGAPLQVPGAPVAKDN